MKLFCKSKGKMLVPLALLLFGSTFLSSQADAYTLTGSRVDRPNFVKYWFDSSISNHGYTSAATHGSTAWNGVSGVNLKVNATSTTDASLADVKWFASGNNDDLGDFYAETHITGYLQARSVVSINTPRFSGLDSNRQKETTAHEMGHVLGLDHEDDVPALMISVGWLNGTYPVQDDKDGIYHIYID